MVAEITSRLLIFIQGLIHVQVIDTYATCAKNVKEKDTTIITTRNDMKTILINKNKGEIMNKERVLTQLENMLKLLVNGNYILNIKKQVNKRTLDQNALMWLWFACIENETGTDKQDIHDYYCKLFLKREVSVNGKRELVVSGTSKLDTVAMTNFLNKIQADAASELGIILPLPSDLSFEEFKNQYNNSIH